MIKLKKLLFLSLVFFMKPAFAENPYEGFIYKSWYQGPDIESWWCIKKYAKKKQVEF